MDHDLFGDAADVLHTLLPPKLGVARMRHHRYGLKVWFGGAEVTKAHYEAQVVGPRHVPEAQVLALEVGFHLEHPKPADNEQVITDLLRHERRWRKRLGDDAVAGPFLGRDTWRRLSETWPDVDLGDPDLSVEVAARLLDYIEVLSPLVTS